MPAIHLAKHFLVSLLFLCFTTPLVSGTIIGYDEDTSGDLSNDASNPTDLPSSLLSALDIGTHTISGRALNASDVNADPEYWSFSIGPNTGVTSIKITEYDNSSYVAPGGGGFFGVAAASTITATNVDVGNLLGAALVGVQPGTAINEEILDDLGALFNFGPFNIAGFGGYLTEGTYSFWFQEGNPTSNTPPAGGGPGPNDANDFVDYTFEFQVSSVPEPSSLALFGIGACVAGVGTARRRRRECEQEATS
jgi:hypothetical protein